MTLVGELLDDERPPSLVFYGVVGTDVSIDLPALATVANGDFVAVLATGADRLILGVVL